MGMYGSYFFVFIRAIVCIIWYGIQSFYAGNILSVMLRCIFGSAWENLDNTLSASANVTSKQLLAFFMAWLMEFPFVSGPDEKEMYNAILTVHRCGSTPEISITSSQ
jgi:NCS1 family nucleobase:cation symporter-1